MILNGTSIRRGWNTMNKETNLAPSRGKLASIDFSIITGKMNYFWVGKQDAWCYVKYFGIGQQKEYSKYW